MARPRKPKATQATNELLSSLIFVGSVLKEHGSPNETHILLSNGWAVAFNGVISSGCPINSNLYAAPNYTLLIAALAKCSDEFGITLEGDRLKIQSGKFKAIVPCLDPSLISTSGIDTLTSPLNDAFKEALIVTGAMASETGERIHTCSILINGQSLVSSDNGVVILEYWHGNEMPTNIAVPKALVAPLTKTTKRLTGFGYSPNSVTFYFEDNSWVKSQLFKEEWPDVGRFLNVQSNPFETPKDLWEGITAIGPHSIDGLVYFDNGILRSHPKDSVGASYEVKGLPKGPIFNIKQLMFLKDHVKQFDFFVNGGKMTTFFGDKCRGVIAGRIQDGTSS